MNAELVASLAQFQKRKAARDSLANLTPSTKAAPTVTKILKKSTTSESQEAADPSKAAVSKRIAIFEKQNRPSTAPSHKTLTLRCGTGSDEKVLLADVAALRAQSSYIQNYFPQSSDQSEWNELDLHTSAPHIVQVFLDFCQKPKKAIPYQPGNYSSSSWIDDAVPAWVLAHEMGASRFEIYVLSQFIQNCSLCLSCPWTFIEKDVPSKSSLALFANHWVAWNSWLMGGLVHEYMGLRAAKRYAKLIGPTTRDPRVYEIEHWYSECGKNVNAQCEHDPLTKKRKEEIEERQRQAPPAEWGAEEEAEALWR